MLTLAHAGIIGATLLLFGVRWDTLVRRGSEKESAAPAPTPMEVSPIGLGYRTLPAVRVAGEPRLPPAASGVAPLGPIELMVAPTDARPAQRILRRLLLDDPGKETTGRAAAADLSSAGRPRPGAKP